MPLHTSSTSPFVSLENPFRKRKIRERVLPPGKWSFVVSDFAVRVVFGLVVVMGCFYSTAATGQQKPRPWTEPAVIPPSPEAANLGRYGNLPVSHYTGAVQLNIPLAEVTDGPLRVPVSLSYHSGGNRVEDVASWTGLGWTLNAGGIITRSVHGQADDLPSRGEFLNFLDLSARYSVDSLVSGGSNNVRASNYHHLSRGCWDAEPDLFSFNFNGYNGQFMFDWNGSIRVQSEHKVQIKPTRVPAQGITRWEITTPDGTVYAFAEAEITQDQRTVDRAFSCRRGNNSFRSTWHLTSITDVNAEHRITFTYDRYDISYGPRLNEAIRYNKNETSQCRPDQNGVNVGTVSHFGYQGLRVRSIQPAHGQKQVHFVPGVERTDIAGLNTNYTGNFRSLAKVSTLDALGQEMSASMLTYAPGDPTGRLTLASVQQTGSGSQTLPPYRFSYSSVTLPAVDSKAQDHWGYYNGAGNNTLLPPFTYPSPTGNIALPGADRNVHPEYALAGVLTRVNYPTGGYSEFDYESNEYGFIGGAPVASLSGPQLVDANSHAAATCDNLAPGAERIVTDTFTILPITAQTTAEVMPPVSIYWGGYNCCAVGQLGKPYVTLTTVSGSPTNKRHVFGFGEYLDIPHHGSPAPLSIYLDPGRYVLTARVRMPLDGIPPDDPYGAPFAVIEARFKKPAPVNGNNPGPTIVKKLGGGVRVREIRDYATSGSGAGSYQRRLFYYNYQNNPALSSGSVHNEPQYQYDSYFMHPVSDNQGALNQAFDRCDNIMRVARSCASLGMTQGSYVGYQEVTVQTEGNGANGKTVYRYTSPAQYTNAGATTLPFTPNYSEGYMTGLLTQQSEYKKTGQAFQLVKRTVNEYTHYSRELPSFLVAFPANYAYLETSVSNYEARLYAQKIGHGLLTRTRQIVYASAGRDSLQTQTRFVYDSDGTQLAEEQQWFSAGEKQITKHFYLDKFAATPTTLAGALTKHAIPRLESVTTVEQDGMAKVVGGVYYDWQLQAGKLRQRGQRELRTPMPLASAAYRFAAMDADARPDERLKETVIIDAYDSKGNIIQLHQPHGPRVARLWGHGRTLLMAEVQNASYANSAYTGFEPDATGRWVYDSTGVQRVQDARAGGWAYRLDNNGGISRSALPAGDYDLVYWSKGAPPVVTTSAGGAILRSIPLNQAPGGWQQHKVQLRLPANGALDINGSGTVVDEVRLYPTGAQMNTYTYDVRGLLTSQADSRGRITIYEYDALGRLLRARDEQGRVLSENEYKYARP